MPHAYLTVFGKHGCKYCDNARALLENKPNMQYTYIYLDDQQDVDLARGQMMKLMGLQESDPRPTVPQIFFGSTHFPGGFTALSKLDQDGLLDEMMKKKSQESTLLSNFEWKCIEYDSNDF